MVEINKMINGDSHGNGELDSQYAFTKNNSYQMIPLLFFDGFIPLLHSASTKKTLFPLSKLLSLRIGNSSTLTLNSVLLT